VLRLHGDAFEAARASLVGDIGAARMKVIELKRNLAKGDDAMEASSPNAESSDRDAEASVPAEEKESAPKQLGLFSDED
jgi:hypothetical protein